MGLIVNIFRSDMQDCSNKGISSNHSKFVVVNIDGPFEPTDEMPAVKMVEGNLSGTVKIVPADVNGRSMMGGTYVGTSDSRFSAKYAEITGDRWGASIAPLHDRFE